ncbi:cation:proton antiporter [Dyella halodurans]|uniref:Cation:proton antiporter n=1 Tax=Dyella halodurans TaxID=1920171 RepID=A0ABV9C063_9GAMM|nr:cation:proton antiporter [Dyella halodurans]
MPTPQMSVYYFIQMAIILIACRWVGWLARKMGQPQVIGEMIAGVALGPSLFGLVLPNAQAAIFPKSTTDVLYVVAQLGVGLYMFLVGTEVNVAHFRARYRSALWVSLAGIAMPFALAVLITPWLLTLPGLFAAKTSLFNASVFMGAATAITAFPVLARIIHERGLTGSRLGTLVLTAGAMDDAAAWCMLAIVLTSFGGGASSASLTMGGGIGYALFMIFIGRRALRRLADHVGPDKPLSATVLAVVLAMFCLSAWAMDAIGIHAVFGGFLLGACLPRGALTEKLREQLQPFVVIFLVPIFFTYSGMKTQLTLVLQPTMMLAAVAAMLASFAGKGLACWAAARASGESNNSAMAIASLMNARGMMELILINIALQAGIIEPGLFSILVLMAITSTLMATPLFNWAMRRQPMGNNREYAVRASS